jgi:glycosyltransferase involved in cell wall biosynthesis
VTRVLVVTPSYPVADDPRAGIFIARQVARLQHRGLDCRAVVYRPGPPAFPRWLWRRSWLRYYRRRLRHRAPTNGVPVDEVFYRRQHDEDVVAAIAASLRTYAERQPRPRPDVIYAQFLWTAGSAALTLRARLGCPVVAIARGSEMHEWQELRPGCREHVEHVLRTADLVLANCDDLRRRAEALVPGSGERIAVVYNGCDPRVFRPAADRASLRRMLSLDGSTRLLVFCGSIEERKGVRELADAWRVFAGAHPEWVLVLAGRVADRPLARDIVRVAGPRMRLVGELPETDVLAYLQAADAYVQPSRLEGLANATMEAMAVGLPVIVTDTCGMPELVCDGRNGWLVRTGDAGALTRALAGMAANPAAAAELGRAARQTIEERFDADVHASGLADILAEVASRRAAVSGGSR